MFLLESRFEYQGIFEFLTATWKIRCKMFLIQNMEASKWCVCFLIREDDSTKHFRQGLKWHQNFVLRKRYNIEILERFVDAKNKSIQNEAQQYGEAMNTIKNIINEVTHFLAFKSKIKAIKIHAIRKKRKWCIEK